MGDPLQLLERALRGEVVTGFESEPVRRSGERFPVSMSAAPLYEGDTGAVSGMTVIIEDISERRRTERELQEKTSTLAA